jgi:hypothetical protein
LRRELNRRTDLHRHRQVVSRPTLDHTAESRLDLPHPALSHFDTLAEGRPDRCPYGMPRNIFWNFSFSWLCSPCHISAYS